MTGKKAEQLSRLQEETNKEKEEEEEEGNSGGLSPFFSRSAPLITPGAFSSHITLPPPIYIYYRFNLLQSAGREVSPESILKLLENRHPADQPEEAVEVIDELIGFWPDPFTFSDDSSTSCGTHVDYGGTTSENAFGTRGVAEEWIRISPNNHHEREPSAAACRAARKEGRWEHTLPALCRLPGALQEPEPAWQEQLQAACQGSHGGRRGARRSAMGRPGR